MRRPVRRRARKKNKGPFAPIVEDILSQERARVSARRVLGRTVVTTKVSTAGGKTLARSVTIYGKKRDVTVAGRVSKDPLLRTERKTRGIIVKRKKK